MNNNNAKKKGGDGDKTKSTHDVSSDTEESLSIDEEDVEFVTKNALFTKRLPANSKELEEEKKGKNEKNKSHGDADDADDDDDDNVERMFFEQEKAKKKEAWEKKQREMLKKKKKKEENKDDEDDDDDDDDEEGDVRLLLPVKRLDGTLVKKPVLKETEVSAKGKRGGTDEVEVQRHPRGQQQHPGGAATRLLAESHRSFARTSLEQVPDEGGAQVRYLQQ